MRISFSGILSGIVATKPEQKNFINDTARNIFVGLLPIFASVSIMQAFMLENGVRESSIGVFNTVSNAFAVIGMLSVMSAADHLSGKRLVRTMTLFNLPAMLMPLLMLFLSLFRGALTESVFFALSALSFAANSIALNVRSIFAIKMQRFIYRQQSYGTAFGVSGLIFYITALIASFTVKPILAANGYPVLFALAALSVLGAVFFNARLRCIDEDAPPETDSQEAVSPTKIRFGAALRTLFAQKKLRFTLYLHVGRGVINAFVFCFVLIGSNYFGMALSGAAYLTVITTFASIAAYVLVTALYNKLGSVLSALFSLGVCVAGAVLMLFLRSVGGFYAAVALFQIGNIFYAQVVPLACYKIVPAQTLGSFTVIRVVLMQSFEALTTLIFTSVIAGSASWTILLPVTAALVFQMLCCAVSYRDIPSEAGCLPHTLILKRRNKK